MMNTVSLKKNNTLAIAKVAGVLAVAALAIAFFAFPIASLAVCGQKAKVQEATFVSLVKGVATYNSINGTAAPEFKPMTGYVNSGSWLEVSINGVHMAAEITSVPKNGSANGFAAHEGTNITQTVKLHITGLPKGLFTPPPTTQPQA